MVSLQDVTTLVEDHIRALLAEKYGAIFTRRNLKVHPSGQHEFAAVTPSGRRIVASIKTASGRAGGGDHPAVDVMNCLAELYFLSIARGVQQRVLVLTSPAFHRLFTRAMTGKHSHNVDVVLLELPAGIQAKVDAKGHATNGEVVPTLDRSERRALGGR